MTPAQKTQAVQKLRQEFSLAVLLTIAQLPRATFYYHLKRMDVPDKYKEVKAEITAIYHENKGRYGYRRITIELHNRGLSCNHKTVQRLMKLLYLQEFTSIVHVKRELVDYLDYYNNHRIKAKIKGLPPAILRQQALSVA